MRVCRACAGVMTCRLTSHSRADSARRRASTRFTEQGPSAEAMPSITNVSRVVNESATMRCRAPSIVSISRQLLPSDRRSESRDEPQSDLPHRSTGRPPWRHRESRSAVPDSRAVRLRTTSRFVPKRSAGDPASGSGSGHREPASEGVTQDHRPAQASAGISSGCDAKGSVPGFEDASPDVPAKAYRASEARHAGRKRPRRTAEPNTRRYMRTSPQQGCQLSIFSVSCLGKR